VFKHKINFIALDQDCVFGFGLGLCSCGSSGDRVLDVKCWPWRWCVQAVLWWSCSWQRLCGGGCVRVATVCGVRARAVCVSCVGGSCGSIFRAASCIDLVC